MIASLLCYLLLGSKIVNDTIDIAQLKRDFAQVEGGIYEISIQVDLPGKCSTKSLIFSENGMDGGHCAVRLARLGEGRTIARTIGFYPSDGISPLNVFKNLQSEIRNDSSRHFDFTYVRAVSEKDFFLILEEIGAARKGLFNTFRFNCVDFCLQVVSPAIQLATKTTVAFGNELHTPHDLKRSLIERYRQDNGSSRLMSECPDEVGKDFWEDLTLKQE